MGTQTTTLTAPAAVAAAAAATGQLRPPAPCCRHPLRQVPTAPLSTHDPLSQQKSQDRGWAGLWTAVMATMAPAAFCLAAASMTAGTSQTFQTSKSFSHW